MENIENNSDILIETMKYTSEIIVNITEKLNTLELKMMNMEEIINDQIKINNKNVKTIEIQDKLINELYNKNYKLLSNTTNHDNKSKIINHDNKSKIINHDNKSKIINHDNKSKIINHDNKSKNQSKPLDNNSEDNLYNKHKELQDSEIESMIDFNIISQKDYDNENNNIRGLIKNDNNENKETTEINRANILIETLIKQKNILENQISKEQHEMNSKKINIIGEKEMPTTKETLITRRRTNMFRKV